MNATAVHYSANKSTLNLPMVKILVLKDWYLLRWPILWAVVAGVASLVVSIVTGKAGFYIGIILLVTVMVGIGAHVAITTVVTERKEQTLSFIISLPISSRDFAAAKILSNLLIFLVPWAAISIGTLALILNVHGVPHGLVPYVAIMTGEILVSTCLITATAILSESQGWTIAAVIVGNLAFNGFGYFVGHIQSIAAPMWEAKVVWNQASITILSAEFAAVVLLLGLTFVVQTRKTDFL